MIRFQEENHRTLSDLLNDYSFNMDTIDQTDGGEGGGENDEMTDHYLEESWTEVITAHEGMTSKEKIQQETIWELLITERNYMRKIRVIIVVCVNVLGCHYIGPNLEVTMIAGYDVTSNVLFTNL